MSRRWQIERRYRQVAMDCLAPACCDDSFKRRADDRLLSSIVRISAISLIVRHFVQSWDEILTCNSVQDYNNNNAFDSGSRHHQRRAFRFNKSLSIVSIYAAIYAAQREAMWSGNQIIGWLVITELFAVEAARLGLGDQTWHQ